MLYSKEKIVAQLYCFDIHVILNEQIILLNYEIGRRSFILVRLDDPVYKKKKRLHAHKFYC